MSECSLSAFLRIGRLFRRQWTIRQGHNVPLLDRQTGKLFQRVGEMTPAVQPAVGVSKRGRETGKVLPRFDRISFFGGLPSFNSGKEDVTSLVKDCGGCVRRDFPFFTL